MPPSWLRIAPEVAEALAAGGAVVALESAVISHGLPSEQARHLADRLDEVVRRAGATPALVAVREGRVEVGLPPAEIAFLLSPGAMKAAARDLAVAAARRASGGTTVAGTLAVAHAAGIRVMATGGIGGVHYGVEASGDVSADLAALSRYPVVVVCAGPKAICDPRRTIEVLDSLGVPVVGFRTATLPGFLARSTGVLVPHQAESAGEIAAIARAMAEMGDQASLLVVQPPPEEAAMDERELAEAVASALARARAEAVTGPALTPFLLKELSTITGGRAVEANLAVLEANAALAAQVAVAVEEAGLPRGPLA